MECNWVIGQKVVCIVEVHQSWFEKLPHITFPEKNKVYTIRDIFPAFAGDGTYPSLLLVEIVNPIRPVYNSELNLVDGEFAFVWTGFAPLQEKKTDISIFNKLLRPVKEYV